MEFINKLVSDVGDIKAPEMCIPSVLQQSREQFEAIINNPQAYNSHYVFNFIKSNIDYIYKCILDKDVVVIGALTNPVFIRQFSLVVNSMPITTTAQLCVNKICYDYFTSDYDDQNIKKDLLDTSKIVNAEEIKQLMGIGLDQNTACNLALCRYSSVNEKVNIKRLNFVICSKDPDMMTEQMIIWIYEKLFDRVSDLFNVVMLESYIPTDILENDSSFMEILSTISLAVLTIVNNMPISSINRVVSNYVKNWDYIGRPKVSVSLRSLSADFGRIVNVVAGLESQNIYVP